MRLAPQELGDPIEGSLPIEAEGQARQLLPRVGLSHETCQGGSKALAAFDRGLLPGALVEVEPCLVMRIALLGVRRERRRHAAKRRSCVQHKAFARTHVSQAGPVSGEWRPVYVASSRVGIACMCLTTYDSVEERRVPGTA